MPTLHPIPIVPGTLCWFRTSANHPNNGAIVEVVAPCSFFADKGKFWFAKAKVQMHVLLVTTTGPAEVAGRAIWPAGTEFAAKETWLVPIAGPGLTDEVVAYDKKVDYKTVAELGAAFGTRSIPNVRR